MYSCRTAIIPFIYPGLGQIYKREIPKGVRFAALCTLLIAALLFVSIPSLHHYTLSLSILILMWSIAQADAVIGAAVGDIMHLKEIFWCRQGATTSGTGNIVFSTLLSPLNDRRDNNFPCLGCC